MAGNANLNAAARAKKDEFYTQLEDIEAELKHYRKHFKGKTVLCNCDDPFESNFFKYFALNFNRLGLKKLIATSCAGSPIAGTQMQFPGMEDEPDPQGELFQVGPSGQLPYKAVITHVEDATGDGAVNMVDVKKLLEMGENELSLLEGDGDFRSQECLELLDEADIVCTNPPFSLFREYMHLLFEHDKTFLVIGSLNAIKYKEIFPYFMANELWLGPSIHSGDRKFYVPDYYPLDASGCGVDEDGNRYIRVKGVRWFTNLDNKSRHEQLILYRRYDPEQYPSYVNYPAIDVKIVADIPCDYSGAMGVPITFMDKYNPEQFEIIGLGHGNLGVQMGIHPYERSLKILNKGLRDGDLFYIKNDIPYVPYTRMVIRNKHPEVPQ